MATFHVYEDFDNKENLKPKIIDFHPSDDEFSKKSTAENRTAFQPLNYCRQNWKKAFLCSFANNQNDVLEKKINEEQEKTREELCLPTDILDIIGSRPKKICYKTICRPIATNHLEKEYEEDIWNYLLFLERKFHVINPGYMVKQVYLNWEMRSVLIDWLISVADEYKMSDQTIHFSVNYLDRFLSNISVIREKFQLVGAAAMLIAGKVDEIYPPDAKEWSYLTGDTFTVRQILKMEQLLLKVLDFNVHPPTVLDFIKHICARHKMDAKIMHLAMYLSELVLMEGREYLKHFPSKLASAAVVLARHTLYQTDPWPEKLATTSGYTLRQLSPVVKNQYRTFKSSPYKDQKAIQNKYSSKKYNKVAFLRPRALVFDEAEDEE